VRLPGWLIPGRRYVASPAARAGIIAASANVAATFARGLLPRSAAEQAIATGVCTVAMYQAATTAHATAETVALFTTDGGGMRGRTADPTRTMIVDLAFVGLGAAAGQLLHENSNEALPIALFRFGAETLMVGGGAGAVVSVIDVTLKTIFPGERMQTRPLLADVCVGGAIAGITVFARHRNARKFGLVDPERRAVKRSNAIATAKAIGTGVVAAGALMAVVSGEELIAESVTGLLDKRLPGFDIGSPLVGHSVALGAFGVMGVAAFSIVKRRVEVDGDVVEAAYPEPPSSAFVSAGPASLIEFDDIGKEGRRFVLMALTAAEIEGVMQEPAIDPIRIVAGFDSAPNSMERAELCFEEMKALGVFDRSLICIASPTGVGYVSYTFAESLEYLTRGDCAIVLPQYALVPSALALFDTHDGVNLQRRVIELTARHIAQMPPDKQPRLVQFGESLGAQVALDVAYPHGSASLTDAGLDSGLYFGVPFRSTAWMSWRSSAELFDPARLMTNVAQPSEILDLPERNGHPAKHVMVIHDDDPVNKFTYRLVVTPPWWMGPPTTRPPQVPRETIWRPVTTFVLTLVDLMNGMDFTPGEFLRRGHDYRIDAREAVAHVFELPNTDEQAAAIEIALRTREQEWATRRLVARKFANARDSVTRTLSSWGVAVPSLPGIAEMGIPTVADVDPEANKLATFNTRFGSSGLG